MKLFFGGMLLITAVSFTACSGKPADILVQKWKITDLTGVPTDKLSGASIEFMKDGKYHSVVMGGDETGTFTLSDDGKVLTMKPITGQEGIINVKELSRDKFVSEKNGITLTAVPQ